MKKVKPANNDQIAKAIDLLKGADSLELKLTVPESDQRSSVMSLDMDVLDAELGQVIFFDTPDLKLSRSGVVVRARRMRKGGDTVVKLRPVRPADVPKQLRRTPNFKVEVDAMPGSIVCSASLKGKANNSDVKAVLQARQPIRKLFSREQRQLYKKYAPEGVTLDSLTPLGPLNIARLKFVQQAFRGFLKAEMWFYPDASRVLELSTKCAPDEAFRVLAEVRAVLKRHGINLTGAQETKTHKALKHFSHLATAK